MSEDGVEGGFVGACEADQNNCQDSLDQKRCSQESGGIEQARYEGEQRTRTLRSWFEGVSVDLDYKVLPVVVRHCARQITQRHVRSDEKKQIERLHGRPQNGQVPEFAEVNHFRDPQKAADTSKLYDRWSLRLNGNDFGNGWTLRGYTSESPQVSIHLETSRRPAMGQQSAE